MVAHEYPGINATFSISDVPAEALKEPRLVLIVPEDRRLVDSAHHDMVERSGNV